MRNGRRCCAYDDDAVLDDIVQCEFRPAETPEETEATRPEDLEPSNPPCQEFELQSVPPNSSLAQKANQSDPVGQICLLDCSRMEESEVDYPPDTSFSWLENSGNANYLYMED